MDTYKLVGPGSCLNDNGYWYDSFEFTQFRLHYDDEVTLKLDNCASICKCVKEEVDTLVGLGAAYWGMEYNPSYVQCNCDVSPINDKAVQRSIMDTCKGENIPSYYGNGYANSKIVSSDTLKASWLMDTTCYALEIQGGVTRSTERPSNQPSKKPVSMRSKASKKKKKAKAKGKKNTKSKAKNGKMKDGLFE